MGGSVNRYKLRRIKLKRNNIKMICIQSENTKAKFLEENVSKQSSEDQRQCSKYRGLPLKKRVVAQYQETESSSDRSGQGTTQIKEVADDYKKIEYVATEGGGRKGVFRNVNILPGVIRHSSLPNNNIVFYYQYTN